MKIFGRDIGLKFKITVLVIMLLLLLMGSVSYLFSIREFKSKREEIRTRMTEIAEIIASIMTLEGAENWDTYQEFINYIPKEVNNNVIYIAIYGDNNRLNAFVLNQEAIAFDGDMSFYSQRELVNQLVNGELIPEAKEDLQSVEVEVNFGEETGRVIVGFSMLEVNWKIYQLFIKSLILFGIFMLIGIAASILLGSTLSKPLVKITEAIGRVSKGNLSQKLDVKTEDEIGKLSKTFNFMIDELREKEFFENFERDLSKLLKPEKISELVFEKLQQNANITAGMFTLYSEDDKFKTVFYQDLNESELSKANELILKKMTTEDFKGANVVILCPEILKDKKFEDFFKLYNIDYITFLARKERLIGIFYFQGKKEYKTFNKLKFIENIMRYALLPYENAILYESLTEKERLKKELEIARNVQMSLLPKSVPEIPDVDIYGMCVPANEVGGDYYDFIKLDEDSYGLIIADVSGKGTSAAFYMAEIKGMITTLSHIYDSPSEILKVLNKRLFGTIDRKMFATMVYGIYNTKNREFIFSRAGHNAIMVKNQNGVSSIIPDGIGIGLEKGKIFDSVIEEGKIILNEGDIVFLYTDGIVEAMNRKKDEFGEKRIIEILNTLDNASSKNICHIVFDEVKRFSEKAEQHDDITMMAIKQI